MTREEAIRHLAHLQTIGLSDETLSAFALAEKALENENAVIDRVLEIIDGCKFTDDTELNPYDGIMWHNKALEQAKQAVLALKGR